MESAKEIKFNIGSFMDIIINTKKRVVEKGQFVSNNGKISKYVTSTSGEIKEIHHRKMAKAKSYTYIFKLEIAKLSIGEEQDKEKTVKLILPTSNQECRNIMKELGAVSMNVCDYISQFDIYYTIRTPTDYAKIKLQNIDFPLKDSLMACLDIKKYGIKLIGSEGIEMTHYGMLVPFEWGNLREQMEETTQEIQTDIEL